MIKVLNHWSVYLLSFSCFSILHLIQWEHAKYSFTTPYDERGIFGTILTYLVGSHFILLPMFAFVILPFFDILITSIKKVPMTEHETRELLFLEMKKQKDLDQLKMKRKKESLDRAQQNKQIKQNQQNQQNEKKPVANTETSDTLVNHRKTEKSNNTKKRHDPYKLLLYYYVALETCVFIYTTYYVSIYQDRMSHIDMIANALSIGTITTSGVTVAHELFHKLSKVDQFLGNYLLTYSLYNHFSIEHVYGHHKNVGTKKDPATARRNETLYHFLFRSSIGGYIHAWKVENNRLRQLRERKTEYQRVNPLLFHLKENRMLWRGALNLFIPFFIYFTMGKFLLISFLCQTLFTIFLVESVNYFEHYGVERKFDPKTNKYESVKQHHSWDAPFRIASYLFCNIPMHTDHHLHALKPYEQLELGHRDEVPYLEYSYTTMTLISCVPFIFFRIMNRNLDEFEMRKKLNESITMAAAA